MKIRFLFYKAKLGDGKILDNLISGWTGMLSLFRLDLRLLGFSHMEVWLPDEIGNFTYGSCLSSASRGGKVGVRFAPAEEVLKNPKRWWYIEVEVKPERLEVALEEAKRLVGLPYDYAGILGFVIPFVKNDPGKWYCSEISCWFGKLCGIYKSYNIGVLLNSSAIS